MFARIWYEPDGTVKVTSFAQGLSEDDQQSACRNLINDGRIDRAAEFDDVESVEELKALLPSDRSERHKWRKHPSGRGVQVDKSIPDLPNPKKALIDAIDNARSLEDLKAVLRERL